MPPEQKLILVVDDTPVNISVITGALKDTYRTKVATSGAKALSIAGADENGSTSQARASRRACARQPVTSTSRSSERFCHDSSTSCLDQRR